MSFSSPLPPPYTLPAICVSSPPEIIMLVANEVSAEGTSEVVGGAIVSILVPTYP